MKKISACKHCANSGLETMDAVGACNCCDGFCKAGFNGFSPEKSSPLLLKVLFKVQFFMLCKFSDFDYAVKKTAASKVLRTLFAFAYVSTIFVGQLLIKPLPADS